eukprot:Em0015g768a
MASLWKFGKDKDKDKDKEKEKEREREKAEKERKKNASRKTRAVPGNLSVSLEKINEAPNSIPGTTSMIDIQGSIGELPEMPRPAVDQSVALRKPSAPGNARQTNAALPPQELPPTGTTNITTTTTLTTSSRSPRSLGSPERAMKRHSRSLGFMDFNDIEKTFEGVQLVLPPLQTASVKHRLVTATKNASGGGYGFILRKSFQPSPDNPEDACLYHLVEPRADYSGPLMTGDRIIQVNGRDVQEASHEEVVDMIKGSGDAVQLLVASVPELTELNARGALDDASGGEPKPSATKIKMGTGTLRKKATYARKFKAKSAEEVLYEKDSLEQERVWVVHKDGFSLGTLVRDSPKQSSISAHYSLVVYQGKDSCRVRLEHGERSEVIKVDEEDIEKANPPSQDKVEDIIELTNLNESSVLHVLRQRYASSLIHTFAGRHLIVVNPLRPLSLYTDRVIGMFKGCRREDMPPHIFAMGQQAYRHMMTTRSDQSLILMGLSGSGKTFNARYLLRYLATVGQSEHAVVTSAKLDAVELLLHSFGSASTFLNPQATRCSCLYSLEFDPAGLICGATVKSFYLEKNRVAYTPSGEGNFNVLYQLLAGADGQLKSDLLLNNLTGDQTEKNLYVEPFTNPQLVESAAYVWELIQNCLEILNISHEEALGLWSLLAAIYHLGFAMVKKGQTGSNDRFLNPGAAQKAATCLGIHHEELAKDIFNPPQGQSLRLSTFFSSAQGSGEEETVQDSTGPLPSSDDASSSRTSPLDAFVLGLYEQTFSALLLLFNRALQGPASSSTSATPKSRSYIHVLDTPGFQNRELAGCTSGSGFDDLCMNYAHERLQMLFHDFTFTSEQDRYLSENVNWMFSEVAASPLPIIDTIDKHVPQRRAAINVHTDRRGILWLLDEESMFPGGSDITFVERVQMYHGEADERGDPLVKIVPGANQFILFHCQRTLGVKYDTSNWLKRAREHPSTRVVVQILSESKRPCIAALFQGRGIAGAATALSASTLKASNSHSTLTRGQSLQSSSNLFGSPSSSVKRPSLCLQVKFQLDILVDFLRKTTQWFVRCVLPQPPYKLPGALPSPDPEMQSQGGVAPIGQLDVPLVRTQLKRADLVKAARMYKQGFPEHLTFPEFRRRYGALLLEHVDGPREDRAVVEEILYIHEVDKNCYKMGLSQIFLRAGILSTLDQSVELKNHDTMVSLQARCKGWLGRKRKARLELQHSAAQIIQDNVRAAMVIKEWSWWKLFMKVKPMLAVWRADEEIKEKDKKIATLTTKAEALETERDALKEAHKLSEEKVAQLTAQLDETQLAASNATELLEAEQLEKRQLQEQLTSLSGKEAELQKKNEELQLQLAQMNILAKMKEPEPGDGNKTSDSVLEEKYWATRRELETLRQRIHSEHEDEIEKLQTAKKTLEKKLVDAESEVEDLRRNLNQLRKKATKAAAELNDLKLHSETQQSRNAELEKRQRKFDADLSAAKDEVEVEKASKEKLAKEKESLAAEFTALQDKFKALETENKRTLQEKGDLEVKLRSTDVSSAAETDLLSLKATKRELEVRLDGLEDELDEANSRADSLQQNKARLELANQTLRQQHQKELEAREEEMERAKTVMNTKIKTLQSQVDELHMEKQAATKNFREVERQMAELQSKQGDAENEKKLRKKVQKMQVLVQDLQEELEHEREARTKSTSAKALKAQIEELQTSEAAVLKAQKRLQAELEELQIQNDDLSRAKMEAESKVAELTREKAEFESHLEEDQEEMEELMEKQRSLNSQIGTLQSQLSEANMHVTELEDAKHSLEKKVAQMNATIAELENGVNKHQYEASEMKSKELEQKLEAERATSKRLEQQLQRLRNNLDRIQEEKSSETSQGSEENMKRLQRQLRDLRVELQEAERKEQEQSRRRKAAESKLEETEALLLAAQSDLKSAQKRIDSLHQALDMQEGGEESGEEVGTDGEEDHGGRLSSASSGSNYKVDQSRATKGRAKPQPASSSEDELSKKQSEPSSRLKSRRFSDEESPVGLSSRLHGGDRGTTEGKYGQREKDDPIGGRDGGTLERKRVKVKYADGEGEDDTARKSSAKELGSRPKRGSHGTDDGDTKTHARRGLVSYMSDEDDRTEGLPHPRKHSADDLLSERKKSSLLSDEEGVPLRSRYDSTSRDKSEDRDGLSSDVQGRRRNLASPKHSDSESSAPPHKGHAKSLSFNKTNDIVDGSKKRSAKQQSSDDDNDVIEDVKKLPGRQQSKPKAIDEVEDSKKAPPKTQSKAVLDDDEDDVDGSKRPPVRATAKSLVDEDDDEDLELLRRRSRVKEYLSKLDLDSDDGSDKGDRKVTPPDASERRDIPSPGEQTKQDVKTVEEPGTKTVPRSNPTAPEGEGVVGGDESKGESKNGDKEDGMSFQEKQHQVAMRRRRHRKRTIESEQHISLAFASEEPSSPVNGHS